MKNATLCAHEKELYGKMMSGKSIICIYNIKHKKPGKTGKLKGECRNIIPPPAQLLYSCFYGCIYYWIYRCFYSCILLSYIV